MVKCAFEKDSRMTVSGLLKPQFAHIFIRIQNLDSMSSAGIDKNQNSIFMSCKTPYWSALINFVI